MKFSQVFWDFDGTLFNSYPQVAEDIKQSLIELKIKLPSQDELLRLIKTTLGQAALSFAKGDAQTAEKILDIYQRLASKRDASTIPLYKDALQSLQAVVKAGGQNYLYTHRDKSALEALSSKNALKLFKDVLTSEHGFKKKPSPDALNFLIDKHSLPKNACCMVGDRPIDLDAAKNAGIAAVLFDPENYYPDYPCDYRFSNFADLTRTLFDS
ncbi:MAG: HAD-IA family hydrolase [Eubacteriales bacterium]|nr:HAD-IA family hydrolase [Eubacteriales bacterium]